MTPIKAKEFLVRLAIDQQGDTVQAVGSIIEYIRQLESYISTASNHAEFMVKRAGEIEFIELTK